MPLARTALSGASQWAGVKSSLKTRFTLTPNISLARAGVAPGSASRTRATRRPLRPTEGQPAPGGAIAQARLEHSAERAPERGPGTGHAHRDQHDHRDVETCMRE